MQHGKLRWDAQRRHREFVELDAQLTKWLKEEHARNNLGGSGAAARKKRRRRARFPVFPGAEALPAKMPGLPKTQHRLGKLNLSRAFVEKRRVGLEKWLLSVLEIPGVTESVHLLEFVGMLSTTRATSGAEVAVACADVREWPARTCVNGA